MAANIIDGKAIAEKINRETALLAAELARRGCTPGLAVVLVGDNPASQVYVGMKERKCRELGIHSDKRVLPADAAMHELEAVVDELNADPRIHGILVQSPPPPQIDERAIIERIDPARDVDCFHPCNVGKLLIGDEDGFAPCTPKGVMELLRYSGIDPAGKHAVVIGRSNIVGKPLLALLLQKHRHANATVTCVHSGTPDLASFTRQADILIAAMGRPEFVRGEMIKPGAAVIDVGINRVEDAHRPSGYRLVGDVCFDEAREVAGHLTPVPGGVGPMTIAMLMRNTVRSAERAAENL